MTKAGPTEALGRVSTARLSRVLLKRGARSAWMKGPRPLRAGVEATGLPVWCAAAAAPASVAAQAAEWEAFEEWALARLRDGAALPGLYPPDAATRAAYEAEKG